MRPDIAHVSVLVGVLFMQIQVKQMFEYPYLKTHVYTEIHCSYCMFVSSGSRSRNAKWIALMKALEQRICDDGATDFHLSRMLFPT